MATYLEVDGVTVGPIENFVYIKPKAPDVWGPVYVFHKKTPAACTFDIRGAVSYGKWSRLVNEEGELEYEIKLGKIDIEMALGGSVSHVQALIVED